MMTYVVMLCLVILTATIQLLFPAWAGLGCSKPPLLLGLTLYYALNREWRPMLIAGLIAGLAQDLLGMMPPGCSSLLFCALGLVAARFRRLVLTESVVTAVVFGALAAVLFHLGAYVMLVRGHQVWWPLGRLLYRALAAGVLAGVTTPLVFLLAHSFDRVVGNIEVREVIDGIEQPFRH